MNREQLITRLEEIKAAVETRAREHDCKGFHCSTCVPCTVAEDINGVLEAIALDRN